MWEPCNVLHPLVRYIWLRFSSWPWLILVTAEFSTRFQWIRKNKLFMQWISSPVVATLLSFIHFQSPLKLTWVQSIQGAKGQAGGGRIVSTVSVYVQPSLYFTQKASQCFSEKGTESLSRLKTHCRVVFQLYQILSVWPNPDGCWCLLLPRERTSQLLFSFITVGVATYFLFFLLMIQHWRGLFSVSFSSRRWKFREKS